MGNVLGYYCVVAPMHSPSDNKQPSSSKIIHIIIANAHTVCMILTRTCPFRCAVQSQSRSRQGGNIQSFLATPTRIYTTVYVYVYVYRYTAYTIYRQHGAKFCQVLSSLPCIRARPYHCISWADSTPTRIYTTLLHYKIYTTLRIFPPWARATTKSDAVGSYRSALLYRSGTRLMGIILPYILYGKRTEDFFWRYGLRAYMKDLIVVRQWRLLGPQKGS